MRCSSASRSNCIREPYAARPGVDKPGRKAAAPFPRKSAQRAATATRINGEILPEQAEAQTEVQTVRKRKPSRANGKITAEEENAFQGLSRRVKVLPTLHPPDSILHGKGANLRRRMPAPARLRRLLSRRPFARPMPAMTAGSKPGFLIHLGIDFILAEQPVQITPFLQKAVPWGLFHCVKGCNGIAAPTGRIDLPFVLLFRRRFRRTLLPAQLVFQPKQLLIIISLPPAGDQSFQKTVVLTVTPKQRHGATFPALFQQTAQAVGLTARRLFLNAGIGQLV